MENLSAKETGRVAAYSQDRRTQASTVRIGEVGLQELKQRLQKDGFADLKEIQRFLAERFNVCNNNKEAKLKTLEYRSPKEYLIEK